MVVPRSRSESGVHQSAEPATRADPPGLIMRKREINQAQELAPDFPGERFNRAAHQYTMYDDEEESAWTDLQTRTNEAQEFENVLTSETWTLNGTVIVNQLQRLR